MLKDIFDAKTMPPNAVTALTKVDPDTIRDWRRQGIIDGIGEQGSNGRWMYSVADCVVLWMAVKLAGPKGIYMELNRALALSHRSALRVMATAVDGFWEEFEGQEFSEYFEVLVFDGDMDAGSEEPIRPCRVQSLAKLDDVEFHRLEVINVGHFAKTMPAEIKGHVIAIAEAYREQFAIQFDKLLRSRKR
ncbi:MerR family transcriptional regulator [Salipiger bermudensis]|uniref:MerR family transcriptional regulator n=1 Tax=Salipiger bermudensis TaxID=344736 RepID=UPI003512B41F